MVRSTRFNSFGSLAVLSWVLSPSGKLIGGTYASKRIISMSPNEFRPAGVRGAIHIYSLWAIATYYGGNAVLVEQEKGSIENRSPRSAAKGYIWWLLLSRVTAMGVPSRGP